MKLTKAQRAALESIKVNGFVRGGGSSRARLSKRLIAWGLTEYDADAEEDRLTPAGHAALGNELPMARHAQEQASKALVGHAPWASRGLRDFVCLDWALRTAVAASACRERGFGSSQVGADEVPMFRLRRSARRVSRMKRDPL